MPKVLIVDSPAGPDKQVEVDAGEHLVDVCDRVLLPIPFSCRSASCATCQVQVLSGAEFLEAMEEDEEDLLDVIGADKSIRLACQIRLKAGAGLIKLRPV